MRNRTLQKPHIGVGGEHLSLILVLQPGHGTAPPFVGSAKEMGDMPWKFTARAHQQQMAPSLRVFGPREIPHLPNLDLKSSMADRTVHKESRPRWRNCSTVSILARCARKQTAGPSSTSAITPKGSTHPCHHEHHLWTQSTSEPISLRQRGARASHQHSIR